MSALSNRTVEHLLAAEIREEDVWLRDDYRQARICVAMAANGEQHPFLASSYAVYGTHPDRVWEKVMGNRRYGLGREFSAWFDQAGLLKPDLPKKRPAIYIDEAAERATKERF